MTEKSHFPQKSIMKLFLLFVLVICGVSCKKESVWQDLLNDPQVLIEIEKRIGNLADDLEVGCYANTGTLKSECEFHANGSTIIKTTESIGRGAKFLVDFVNVSCPRDCTSRCCENPECDTAVFQDKGDRKCYLFHCGDSSLCVFSHHADYWMSSVSKAAHTSHGYTPGGATYSHENELEHLGSGNQETDPPEPQRTTTVAPTTERISPNLPGLGEYCSSYEAVCEDPHAYCLMKQCQCRVGYHEKHGICRKHCRDEELECDNVRYGSDSPQCVPQQYVCDGNPDCVDGSDEKDCPTHNKPDDQAPVYKVPAAGDNIITSGGNRPHVDRLETLPPPSTVVLTTGTDKIVTTQKVTTLKPTTARPNLPTVAAKPSTQAPVPGTPAPAAAELAPAPATQAPADGNQGKQQAPVNTDKKTDAQSKTTVTSINSNKTSMSGSEVKSVGGFNILNADEVQVESYTDSSQGPIIALALGLTITMLLLIIVGCRLRTVKRRLRKGRALHSNEADYLINGMYL